MILEEKYGQLIGSAERRWQKVLMQPIFVIHNRANLGIVAKANEVRVLTSVMEQPEIALAFAKQLSGDQFRNFTNEFFAEQSLQRVETLLESSLNAAMVFGHALFEDVLMSLLRLCFEHSPEHFYSLIADKNVKVSDVRSGNFDSKLCSIVEAWFSSIEKSSLPKKMEVLIVCAQPKSIKHIKDFDYSSEKLDELDNLRHSIVHKTASRPVHINDLFWLKKATMFATALPTELGMQFSSTALFNGMGIEKGLPPDFLMGNPVTYKKENFR